MSFLDSICTLPSSRGLPSPNRADSLVLSFAFPVMAKPRFPDGTPVVPHDNNNAQAGEPYNPLR
jgi:hypothetical protein